MVNFRVRVKKKGKRWIKGQSSTSNPDSNKFRNLARNGYFKDDNAGKHGLTREALQIHNDITNENSFKSTSEKFNFNSAGLDTDSVVSGTCKTFGSFASDWSQCSNASFNRLLVRFNSSSAHHKEMIAVLAAVTEVIKMNGGTETNTEYFAALVTTLDGMKNVEGMEESVAAVLSLLNMCIKSVPRSVLQVKFSSVSAILLRFYKQYTQSVSSGNNIILKSIIGCFSVLLRAQEAAVWNDSSTTVIYDAILACISHGKPKIRHSAQHAIAAILKGSACLTDNNNEKPHPVAKYTGRFYSAVLDKYITFGDVTATLHAFVLLKEIAGIFPEKQLKSCCNSVLKLMTLKNVLLTTCGLEVFHNMFSSKPNPTCCTPQLNLDLIMALYDYQPRITDSQMMLAWMAVMQEAFLNLNRIDRPVCMVQLPKMFAVFTEILLSENANVINNAILVMLAIIKECLPKVPSSENCDQHKELVKDIFDKIQSCMDHPYHKAWGGVIHLTSAIVKECGEIGYSFMLPCLKKLADLRDGETFPYNDGIEKVFASAIQSIGPQKIIQEVPLKVVVQNRTYELRRSWLLPILKQNITNSTLECFATYFLPLATVFWKKKLECKNVDDKPGEISYELLQSQVWALLPSFCTNPSDISVTFPSLAKALGTALNTRKDLSITLLLSLRCLLKSCQKNEGDLKTMSTFAKNYLPILFNLYTVDSKGNLEESIKSSAIDTIKEYLLICDTTLQHHLYQQVLNKLDSKVDSKVVKGYVFDLLSVLLPFQDEESIRLSYQTYIANVLDAGTHTHKEEKKYFRLLETVISSKTEGCQKFVHSAFDDIWLLLSKELSKTAVTSRRIRIKCLIHLVDVGYNRSDLLSVSSELVLCAKDINSKCRENAMVLLGKILDKIEAEKGEHMVRDYFDFIMSGLVGPTKVISCTITSIIYLIHHSKGRIPIDQFDIIVKSICLLCASPSREIVGPALSFIKLLVTTFFSDTLRHLQTVVKTLSGVTDDCKRRFRQRLHLIYDKLIKKAGADTIISLVPGKDNTTLLRLRSLRKANNRKLKKKAKLEVEKSANATDMKDVSLFGSKSKPKTMDSILAECNVDSDDEDNKSLSIKSNHKRSKKRSSSGILIHEDPDDIVDFTDKSAARSISLTNYKPENEAGSRIKKPRDKDGGFKTAPDGRLIIVEKDESASVKQHASMKSSGIHKVISKGNNDNIDEDVLSQEDDQLSLSMSRLNVKRRKIVQKDVSIGIHRNIGKKKSNVAAGMEYRNKKARGDMKKNGKLDPFAYVPLKRDMLNKRKKKKEIGKMKSIVRGAKKGALAKKSKRK